MVPRRAQASPGALNGLTCPTVNITPTGVDDDVETRTRTRTRSNKGVPQIVVMVEVEAYKCSWCVVAIFLLSSSRIWLYWIIKVTVVLSDALRMWQDPEGWKPLPDTDADTVEAVRKADIIEAAIDELTNADVARSLTGILEGWQSPASDFSGDLGQASVPQPATGYGLCAEVRNRQRLCVRCGRTKITRHLYVAATAFRVPESRF